MYGAVNPASAAAAGEDAKRVHDGRLKPAPQGRQTFSSEFVKSAVYGALDGVLTSFAVVSGGEGGSLSPQVVVVLGLSGLFANAMSMGIGDAVSSLSYDEHVASERLREEWEFENFPEGEVEEMVELYESRGLPRQSAEVVVNLMAKYKELFLDIMVAEELGLKPLKPEDAGNYWKGGLVTSAAFVVFGLFPLLAYVLCLDFCPAEWTRKGGSSAMFAWSLATTLVTLFVLGALKSKFTCVVWWRSGIEFCVLGGLCATSAYGIGSMVSDLVGE